MKVKKTIDFKGYLYSESGNLVLQDEEGREHLLSHVLSESDVLDKVVKVKVVCEQ